MQNYGPTWLNESYYQNIPHNEVNWAQLAQQWIAMRDRPEVHTNAPPTDFQQFPPQDAAFPTQFANHAQTMPFPAHQPVFSGGNFGPPEASMTAYPVPRPLIQPAPLPPRNMSGGLLPTPPVRQRFRPPFGIQPRSMQRPIMDNFRPLMNTEIPARPLFPAAGPMIRHSNYHEKVERGESFSNLYNEKDDPSYIPEPVSNENVMLHDAGPEETYRKDTTNPYQASWHQPPIIGGPPQSLLKMPLLPLAQAPHVYRGFYDDEDFGDSSTNFLDAQQKEKLPAWIREGLEKVQKEKMKQMQKEEEERLAKEQETLKKKSGKSRFESDSEEEDDEEIKESKSRQSSPERLNEKAESDDSDQETEDEEQMRTVLLSQLRTWLTEILMSVTKGEIERIANEVYRKKKRKGNYGTDEEEESRIETDNDTATDFSDDDDENARVNSPSNNFADEQRKDDSASPTGSMDNEPFKRPLLPPRVVKTTPAGVKSTMTVSSAPPMTTTTTKEETKKSSINEKLTSSESKSKIENGGKERKSSSRDKKRRSRSKSKEKDRKSSSSFSDDTKEKRKSRWDDSASSNSSDNNNNSTNNGKDSKSGEGKIKSDRSRDDRDRCRSSPKKRSKSLSRDKKRDEHHSRSKKEDDEKKKHRRSRSPHNKDKKSSRKRTRSRSRSPVRHRDSKDKRKKSR